LRRSRKCFIAIKIPKESELIPEFIIKYTEAVSNDTEMTLFKCFFGFSNVLHILTGVKKSNVYVTFIWPLPFLHTINMLLNSRIYDISKAKKWTTPSLLFGRFF